MKDKEIAELSKAMIETSLGASTLNPLRLGKGLYHMFKATQKIKKDS